MVKKVMKRIKNQRGLTLVELLAVIVILGIVSAIAVPSIGGIIDKSKEDALKADAIQVLNAAKLYAASTKIDGPTTLKNDTDTNLNNFLDFKEGFKYEITITPAAATEDIKGYTYTGITVTKDDKTLSPINEDDLLNDKDVTITNAGSGGEGGGGS